MCVAIRKAGGEKLFSVSELYMNNVAGDYAEIARGKYIQNQFGSLSGYCGPRFKGCVAEGTEMTVENSSYQLMHHNYYQSWENLQDSDRTLHGDDCERQVHPGPVRPALREPRLPG